MKLIIRETANGASEYVAQYIIRKSWFDGTRRGVLTIEQVEFMNSRLLKIAHSF